MATSGHELGGERDGRGAIWKGQEVVLAGPAHVVGSARDVASGGSRREAVRNPQQKSTGAEARRFAATVAELCGDFWSRI